MKFLTEILVDVTTVVREKKHDEKNPMPTRTINARRIQTIAKNEFGAFAAQCFAAAQKGMSQHKMQVLRNREPNYNERFVPDVTSPKKMAWEMTHFTEIEAENLVYELEMLLEEYGFQVDEDTIKMRCECDSAGEPSFGVYIDASWDTFLCEDGYVFAPWVDVNAYYAAVEAAVNEKAVP